MYAYLTDKTAYIARDLNTIRWLYAQRSDLGSIPSASLDLAHTLTGEIVLSPPLLLP